jgi:hypothetical protein
MLSSRIGGWIWIPAGEGGERSETRCENGGCQEISEYDIKDPYKEQVRE